MKNNLRTLLILLSFSYAELVRPVNTNNLNYIHIVFEWDQEPNADLYNIQASNNSNFNNVIIFL